MVVADWTGSMTVMGMVDHSVAVCFVFILRMIFLSSKG